MGENTILKSLNYFKTLRGRQNCLKTDRVLLGILWLHVPVALVLAYLLEKSSLPFTIVVALAITLPPTLVGLRFAGSFFSRLLIALAIFSKSALLIHLSGGMIELHFHIFVFLAVLGSYRDFRVLLAGAGFVAVHHISFNFLLPYSLFSYGPNFYMVLLHAFFVVLETVYLVYDILGKSSEFDFVVTTREISAEITDSSVKVSEASQALSETTVEMASSVEEISSTMAEIDSQTRNNTENVQQASESLNLVRKEVDQGSLKLDNLKSAMDSLGQDSRDMFKIIKLIDEIAFQTNLLALNAAVEAARAGDSGRGFAVVAEEVRNLASRSAESAKGITTLIESSVKNVEQSAKFTDETSQIFSEILNSITQSEDLLKTIGVSYQEQAQGISQTTESLQQIEHMMQDNSAHSVSSADASVSLSKKAVELKEMLDEFTSAEDQYHSEKAGLLALPEENALEPPPE